MMRKLLRVDLSSGTAQEEPIPDTVGEAFVGCRGLAAHYLYRELSPGADPLGRHNKLLLAAGPLAGTGALSAAKWMAVTKSPLSGTFTRAIGGDDFGAWLHLAGIELVIIENTAATPVYLYVKEGRYEVRDATEIWGKTTSDTEARLKNLHGPKARVASVGPAAERLVRFAGIFSGGRSASRGGVGTVMASKKLKAVVVEAERREIAANPPELQALVREQEKSYREGMGYDVFRDYGTILGVDIFLNMGAYPVRNFRFGELEGREKISFSKYGAATLQHTGCYSCPLRCGKIRRVERGPYAGTETKGPQYESAWAFTGPTGCSDLEATLYANHLCCELGLDCISTGNVIGFAYELFEKGILTPTDTGGLILEPGNPEPMIELIEAIARREGLGDVLAEGVSRAAERIGHGAEDLAMHVKGLEMPAYDPRARKTEGMNYALANAGANHCYGYADQEIGNPRPRVVDPVAEEGIGDVIKYNHDHTTALELTGSCMFPAHNLGFVDLNLLGRMLAAVLGVEHFAAADYLWHVGEKVYNLERCFNLREGFSRADDRLPRRMLAEPLRGGPCDGEVFRNPEGVVDEYYAARGWDRNGIPTKATLERLGLLELEPEVAPLRR